MRAKKVSITFDFPVRWKLIANGERVIEQTGPDEIEVEVRDATIEGESWLQELSKIFDEAKRELRQSRRRKGQGVADFESRRSLKAWDQNTNREGNRAANKSSDDKKLGTNHDEPHKVVS
jgi:hypothetical protein